VTTVGGQAQCFGEVDSPGRRWTRSERRQGAGLGEDELDVIGR
jgi:hypothetical protein